MHLLQTCFISFCIGYTMSGIFYQLLSRWRR